MLFPHSRLEGLWGGGWGVEESQGQDAKPDSVAVQAQVFSALLRLFQMRAPQSLRRVWALAMALSPSAWNAMCPLAETI